MNKKLISTISLSILVIALVTGCEDSNSDTINTEAETNSETVPIENESQANDVESEKVKEEKVQYGVDEWWEVKDQWKLKIDSVSLTDERNEFSEENPEAVVVIKYTYENLGYEDDVQDLYMLPDNVVDGEKNVARSYPAGSEISAKPTPVGATTVGAEESYGLSSNKGEITVYFDEYDNDDTRQKAMFVIPLSTE